MRKWFCSCRYPSEIRTLARDNNFPYVGALNKYYETNFEFVCTLALLRPFWLIGSISLCSLEYDRPGESKVELSSTSNMIVILHGEYRRIKSMIFPDEHKDSDIILIQVESKAGEIIYPSLEIRNYDPHKQTSCFRVDHNPEDPKKVRFEKVEIETNLQNCKSITQKVAEKWICTDVGTVNSFMFCDTGEYSVDVFGMKAPDKDKKILWTKLSYYRLYIEKIVDLIIRDIFDFPYLGYMNNTATSDPPCTVVLISNNWLLGSIEECRVQKLATSLTAYLNADWDKWMVTIHSGGKKYYRSVVLMEFDEDYNELTQEHELVFIKVEPYVNDTGVFFTMNIGSCFTEYMVCHYIFWIYDAFEWGICSAHTSINYRNRCPTEDLSLKLKDNAICTKKTNVSKTLNSFVLICNKVDNTYEFIGIKGIDYRNDTRRAKLKKKKKERWTSLLEARRSILQKTMRSRPVGLISKQESVAILETESKKICTIAFLRYVSSVNLLWHAGTLVFCNLQTIYDNNQNNVPNDFVGYTVITPYDEKAKVMKMIFHPVVDETNGNTIALIASKLDKTSQYKPNSFQLIPDNKPESQCIKYFGVYNVASQKYDYSVEESTLSDNKTDCKIATEPWSIRDTWCCTMLKVKNETASKDGPLLCQIDGVYHLVGLRSDSEVGNEWRRWMNLLTFKSWISLVIDLYSKEPPKVIKPNVTEPPKYDIDFCNEILLPPYMVKITVRSPKYCICYGFIIHRAWVVTGTECRLSLTIALSPDTYFHKTATDHAAAIEVETRNKDISLVRYIVYAQLSINATLEDLQRDTFAFLRLQWPLMEAKDVVETIKIFDKNRKQIPPPGTQCNVFSKMNADLAKNLGYRGKSGGLCQQTVPIVDTNVCSNYYGSVSTVPWSHASCTKTASNAREAYFSDHSAGLVCGKYLVGIAGDRWFYPIEAIDKIKNGVHVPVGWMRLDSFGDQLDKFLSENPEHLKTANYGDKADWPKFKFMCSFQYKGHHLFSGVVIENNCLLVNDDVFSVEQINGARDYLVVVCGNGDVKTHIEGQENHKIQKAQHVDQESSLAVVRLVDNVTANIPKAKISEDYKIPIGGKCDGVGWPKESIYRWYHYDRFAKSNQLRKGMYMPEFKTVDNYFYTKITESDACLGDVGATLICEGKLVGIGMWDEKCDKTTDVRKRWSNVGKLYQDIKKAVDDLNSLTDRDVYWDKFLVAIMVRNVYTCIGALVHQRWVLTSSVCFLDAKPSDIVCALGISDMNSLKNAEMFSVIQISVPFPSCDDIGMLLLKRSVPLDKYRLIDALNKFSDRECFIFDIFNNMSAGWPPKIASDRTLKTYMLRPKLRSFCAEMYSSRTIQYHHICTYALSDEKNSSFLEYPGGPLICVPNDRRYMLVRAVNAWGIGDSWNGKTAVVWTNLDYYLSWIQFNIRNTPDERNRRSHGDVETMYETRVIYYDNSCLIGASFYATLFATLSTVVYYYYCC